MGAQWTSNPLKVAPEGAVGVTCTSGSPAWTPSAWVELIAAAPADLYSVGVMVAGLTYILGGVVEIGVGAAGAETAIAQYRYAGKYVSAVTSYMRHAVIPIGITVASGSRVSIRYYTGTTGTAAQFAWQYYQAPIVGSILTTSAVLRNAQATTWNPYAGANSAWGVWTEITAATAAAWIVAGLHLGGLTANLASYEMEIGTGAAGAETGLLSVSDYYGSGQSAGTLGGILHALANPDIQIGAGVRVAVRGRCTYTSTARFFPSIQYLEAPL